MKNLASRLFVALCCCLPVAAGCALLPYAGIEMDEALFAVPYYEPTDHAFRLRLFHHDFPLMIMTYIGTLKTLLYWPFVALFGSHFPAHPLYAVWLTRLPMVLAAGLTIFVFFHLAERCAGRWTAGIAALLLASDPTFILTDTFDWGPVALEHLLLVTGCFFLVKYVQDRILGDLPVGFFFLGLALWNKAVFVWALAGLVCASLAVFHRELLKLATRRLLLTAATGFLIGALPFAIYNGHRRGETFRTSAHLQPLAAPAKFIEFRFALNGSGLFGFMVSDESPQNPKQPASRVGRAAVFLHERFGEHRFGLMEYAVALGLLAFPLWWGSRTARFCIVFTTVAWLWMASTQGAGASVHHTVLLWPFPQLFVAVVASSIRWKWVGGSIALLLAAANLLVVNQYIFQFERNGAEGAFTDAIYKLSAAIPENPNQTIYVLDWGIQFPLDLLHNGHLHMRSAHEPFMTGAPSEADKSIVTGELADSGALYLAHVDQRENFTGVHQRFRQAAASYGCQEDAVQTIPDSKGHPVFEMFKMACQTGVW